MAKARYMPRRRRGRIRDKWKDKVWLTVHAPQVLGGTEIAIIPANGPEVAMGRVVETTLYDILKEDPSHYSIKLYFQINQVDGTRAYTLFKGHEYAREYLRNLIRRGSSMVDYANNYVTRDGYKVRVFFVAFTQSRINRSRKHAIRMITHRFLSEKVPSMTYDQLIHEILLGSLSSELLREAKKITPIRHLGIRKTKLLGAQKARPIMPEEKKEEEETVTPSPQ